MAQMLLAPEPGREPLVCLECGVGINFDEVLEDPAGPSCPNCDGSDIDLAL